MAADFVKVYSGFFEGSLRDQPPFARLLFLAMLSKADPDGVALGAPSFWAAYVGITAEQVREALTILSSPDPDSTTPDLDGRRIEPWGEGANRWRIVNYRAYYERSRNEDRKEHKREWDRQHRPSGHARSKPDPLEASPSQSVQSDPESERKTKGKENERKGEGGRRPAAPTRPTFPECLLLFAERGSTRTEAEKFHAHYEANGWVQGRGRAPIKDWRAAARGWILRQGEFKNGSKAAPKTLKERDEELI